MPPSRCALGLSAFMLVFGCTQPAGPDDLSLDASVSSPSIAIGQTDTLTFRLRNLTMSSLSLTFASSCQIAPFIENASDGVAYPVGGQVCATVITHLTLPPSGEHTFTLAVLGDTVPVMSAGAVLPPGSYRGYAVVQPSSPSLRVRSDAVGFAIH
jgi:hypothetical protein